MITEPGEAPNCVNCKKDIPEDNMGIVIENHCLDEFPERIEICKPCTEEIAVGFLSGKLPSFSVLGGMLKGFLKK